MLVATMRLPETLAVDDRITLSAGEVWGSCRAVLITPGTAGYLVVADGAVRRVPVVHGEL